MKRYSLLPFLAAALVACGGDHHGSGSGTAIAVADHTAAALGIELDGSGNSVYHIATFRTNSPSTFLTDVAVTGVDAGDTLAAIDQRPSNGALYAVGVGGTLYTLNATSGVATKVGATNPLSVLGIADMDFDPVADQVRVMSFYVNARLNPATGALIADESAQKSEVGGLAYAPSGTLYAYDFNIGQRETLVKIGTPSSGEASSYTNETLPFFGTATDTNNPLNETGMDISADGKTAILSSFGLKGSSIVLVDLASGKQASVGATPTGLFFQTISVAFIDPVAQAAVRP